MFDSNGKHFRELWDRWIIGESFVLIVVAWIPLMK